MAKLRDEALEEAAAEVKAAQCSCTGPAVRASIPTEMQRQFSGQCQIAHSPMLKARCWELKTEAGAKAAAVAAKAAAAVAAAMAAAQEAALVVRTARGSAPRPCMAFTGVLHCHLSVSVKLEMVIAMQTV